jgi:hypothetical protein
VELTGRYVSAFDYFMIFVTIIIALAIEAVAKDVDTLIAAKRRVKWHWMAPATALNSILLILSQFWLFWQLRQHAPFSSYVVALSPIATMLMLFLVASAALPSDVPPEGLDLKEWYFGNRARFWGLSIALLGCFIATNVVVYFAHIEQSAAAIAFIPQCLLAAALCASLIFSRAVWWHTVVILLLITSNVVSNSRLTLG